METIFNDTQALSAYVNIIISICFFIAVAMLGWAYVISKKPKITKKSSEIANVISPILAEVLVDGKIDIKNLILTTIAELQIKGNIAIVNDNVIELLYKKNLNMYELCLVDLIFFNKKSVTFGEINDRFSYNMRTIEDFKMKMSKVTEEIQSRFYEINLFSKKKTLLLNFLSYVAMVMLINFPIIILEAINQSIVVFWIFTIFLSIVTSIMFFSRLAKKSDLIVSLEPSIGFNKNNISILSYFIIFEAFLLLVIISDLDISILGMLGVYIVNFLILRMTRNNVLSEKGLEERRKVLELRNFLKDYDLRKTENGESYIVWNKYFAYSAAFGISNPVISEIYKSWNRLNIQLSFTKNII